MLYNHLLKKRHLEKERRTYQDKLSELGLSREDRFSYEDRIQRINSELYEPTYHLAHALGLEHKVRLGLRPETHKALDAIIKDIHTLIVTGKSDEAQQKIIQLDEPLLAQHIAKVCISTRSVVCAVALLKNLKLKDHIPSNQLEQMGDTFYTLDQNIPCIIGLDPTLRNNLGYSRLLKWVKFNPILIKSMCRSQDILNGLGPRLSISLIRYAAQHLEPEELVLECNNNKTLMKEVVSHGANISKLSGAAFLKILQSNPSLLNPIMSKLEVLSYSLHNPYFTIQWLTDTLNQILSSNDKAMEHLFERTSFLANCIKLNVPCIHTGLVIKKARKSSDFAVKVLSNRSLLASLGLPDDKPYEGFNLTGTQMVAIADSYSGSLGGYDTRLAVEYYKLAFEKGVREAAIWVAGLLFQWAPEEALDYLFSVKDEFPSDRMQFYYNYLYRDYRKRGLSTLVERLKPFIQTTSTDELSEDRSITSIENTEQASVLRAASPILVQGTAPSAFSISGEEDDEDIDRTLETLTSTLKEFALDDVLVDASYVPGYAAASSADTSDNTTQTQIGSSVSSNMLVSKDTKTKHGVI